MATPFQQRWARRLCLSLLIVSTIALPQAWGAPDLTIPELPNMPRLAQLMNRHISQDQWDDWDDVYAYVRQQQNAIVPEVRAIVSDPRTGGTAMEIAYGLLRQVPTLESAMLLAQGFSKGGGQASVFGLIENPRLEVYPVLKEQLRPPAKEKDKDLLLTMAQIPVPSEQRIADLKPYMVAKHFGVRVGAVFGLALLDDPGSMDLMVRALSAGHRGRKMEPLMIFYQFRAWRIPKFVPVLIPLLNDPLPIRNIGLRRYDADGSETDMTPEALRYVRAWDFALNIIVKTLKMEVPFKIEDDVTYSKEQRDLVKQKLRDLGYAVTDEPYPVTDGV